MNLKNFFINSLILLKVYLVCCPAFASNFAWPVLAFGDLRGNFEPCGCDPRTDVGGVQRLSAAIERYRITYPDVIIVHTGNIVGIAESDVGKVSALFESLEFIKPNVSLFNVLEWELTSNKKSIPSLNWLSTNLKESVASISIHKRLVMGQIEFYGYTSFGKKVSTLSIKEVIAYIKKSTQISDASKRMLLFSGSDSELNEFVKSGLFGAVISSNTSKYGALKGDEERKNENILLRTVPGKNSVWMVPYGATGVLRQGGLESKAIPLTLATSLSKQVESAKASSILPGISTKPEIALTIPIHWLTVSEDEQIPEKITAIVGGLRAKAADKFIEFVKRREPLLKDSKFAGAETCSTCHSKAFEVWKNSKHAQAMTTLFNKVRHEDLSCVECHVVGFHKDGGYVSQVASPKLANVQCESCHGAAKDHISNPTIKPQIKAFESCAGCHTPPHSPGFEKKSYWEKIRH